MKLSGLVSPGASIQQVLNNAAKSQNSTLLIIAGTNDVPKRSTTVFYKTIEDKLKKLSEKSHVLITTVPQRYNASFNDPTHDDWPW